MLKTIKIILTINLDVALLIYFTSIYNGYIVNKTRSSLDLNIVNILVCLRDWCRCSWSSNFRYISIAK